MGQNQVRTGQNSESTGSEPRATFGLMTSCKRLFSGGASDSARVQTVSELQPGPELEQNLI